MLTAYFTAFQAKCELNSNTAVYEYALNLKIPNFKVLFYNWQLVCYAEREPSLREINIKFQGISKKKNNTKDYQKIVDNIIQGQKKKEPPMLFDEPVSKAEKMDEELRKFQTDLMKGEVLGRIDDIRL